MKNLKIAFAVLLGVAALFISFYNWNNLKKLENKIRNLEKMIIQAKSLEEKVETQAVTIPENKPPLVTFTGTIRKEEIPAELELGDYWYWIYFDEPYTLEQNAAGFPMEVEKLQVNAPQGKEGEMDNFDGKHVEVKGYITWGYAESSVIQAEEIAIK